MIDLSYRHNTKELMDRDDIPFADMALTLRELDTINTLLGGHSITLNGLRSLVGTNRQVTVCEIGCGGGDNLRVIYRWGLKNKVDLKLIGVDINEDCIRFAEQQQQALHATWICSDYATADLGPIKPDIIFSSLFCHHFTDDQLVAMMQWLAANSSRGFFINDLHRHPMAYYLIKYITRFFSRSYLVSNDAAVSVSRGFSRSEWSAIFQRSGVTGYSIRWKWAFRWLIIQQTRA